MCILNYLSIEVLIIALFSLDGTYIVRAFESIGIDFKIWMSIEINTVTGISIESGINTSIWTSINIGIDTEIWMRINIGINTMTGISIESRIYHTIWTSISIRKFNNIWIRIDIEINIMTWISIEIKIHTKIGIYIESGINIDTTDSGIDTTLWISIATGTKTKICTNIHNDTNNGIKC